MADYIERKALQNAIMLRVCSECSSGYCYEECHNRCRAAEIIELIENAPAVTVDDRCWNKTTENPPTKKDEDESGSVLSIRNTIHDGFPTSWQRDLVIAYPEQFPVWMQTPDKAINDDQDAKAKGDSLR